MNRVGLFCPKGARTPDSIYFTKLLTTWRKYVPHEHQEKLEMVQRRAARFVKSRYKRTDSVTAMLDEQGWPILSKRCKDARLNLFYKIINNLAQVRTP